MMFALLDSDFVEIHSLCMSFTTSDDAQLPSFDAFIDKLACN